MKLRYLFLAVLFIASCDNDLDIIADYKDIPIVYGVLAISDTAQYIRVEKAFIDDATSAFELAKIADSLYYENAQVSIRHEGGQEYILDKVDGNLEGYMRDEGAFAQAPNYLYKIRTEDIALIPDDEYTLLIDRGDNSEIVSSTISLVGPSDITTPDSNMGFSYSQGATVRWRPGANARIFDVYIRVNYRERIIGGAPVFERKSVTWLMGSGITSTNSAFEVSERPGIDFYSFMAGALVASPDIERRFDDITVIVDSGGNEILELDRINDANLGITSSQDVPNYSNLSEGIGIFSSKYREEKPGIGLNNNSLDSLVNGVITKNLNFQF